MLPPPLSNYWGGLAAWPPGPPHPTPMFRKKAGAFIRINAVTCHMFHC